MSGRRRVFLTGATGNWGRCVLREFAARADRFDVVALVLPTRRDRAAIGEFSGMPNLRVVWGDLTDYSVVEACVRGSDHVLHVGAVVSPQADDHPALARRVNVDSARNIIRAVRAQADPAAIGVVMIGSVAQTGDRNPPHHWGRVGDPLRVSQFDEYGQTKITAERALVESRLPRWAWLRQTGIFHPGLLQIRDAIMTHVPCGGVMEWVSAEDSARLLANLCEDGVPDEFWGRVYNIGGGEAWRLTNWEFQVRLAGALGVRDVRRWYERNWFAIRNFHGQWYTDSDDLERLVPFRRDTVDEALARAVRASPRAVRLAGKVPAAVVKNLVVGPLTRQPRGTMAWIRDNDDARIRAYFGSHAEWRAIGDWSTFQPPAPDPTQRLLDHGYDETKQPARWNRDDLAGVADFRGGQLLSEALVPGDIATRLRWRCAQGHEFLGSPRLILAAGHWCPECVKDPAGYPKQAIANRFLAQVEPTS
ncbi:NAD(P)H-binding protein [Frankia sp. CNm7]|uniref:NAD(P)H-binding protein n=1 Tax=Frankia nepalensis TaxID=1836974 RepID=A0A937RA46_9ACTN|nr:NAD-dependent epimerase/dehydratase family protein [Frankia nepalensis]MBL7498838.1 NAD(P)H-binding protein [Frankia nepalensis]MBL7508643.1 NAD(P)H-binding protein [Frankia nepalensis]MBL7519831.1 NAD(P)H-binding protein [Frankia nepalensis]MBL7628443.1 NAD(P)H-binding protein [Frankia nepalensis]